MWKCVIMLLLLGCGEEPEKPKFKQPPHTEEYTNKCAKLCKDGANVVSVYRAYTEVECKDGTKHRIEHVFYFMSNPTFKRC